MGLNRLLLYQGMRENEQKKLIARNYLYTNSSKTMKGQEKTTCALFVMRHQTTVWIIRECGGMNNPALCLCVPLVGFKNKTMKGGSDQGIYGTPKVLLPLLPSGPDGVYKFPLRMT